MKKRNGFTIVELLAVLTILAVILTIAVPAATKWLNKAQDATYTDFEKSMREATRNYFIEHSEDIPSVGNSIKISLDTLTQGQYLETLHDPEKDTKFCTGYVKATRGTTSDNYNIKLDYAVCLQCSRYQSATCE